jgi:hypothetical protein
MDKTGRTWRAERQLVALRTRIGGKELSKARPQPGQSRPLRTL